MVEIMASGIWDSLFGIGIILLVIALIWKYIRHKQSPNHGSDRYEEDDFLDMPLHDMVNSEPGTDIADEGYYG